MTHVSLLHLMRAIARTQASTRATSLMCVKNSTHHLSMTLIAWGIGMKKMKQRSKALH